MRGMFLASKPPTTPQRSSIPILGSARIRYTPYPENELQCYAPLDSPSLAKCIDIFSRPPARRGPMSRVTPPTPKTCGGFSLPRGGGKEPVCGGVKCEGSGFIHLGLGWFMFRQALWLVVTGPSSWSNEFNEQGPKRLRRPVFLSWGLLWDSTCVWGRGPRAKEAFEG